MLNIIYYNYKIANKLYLNRIKFFSGDVKKI